MDPHVVVQSRPERVRPERAREGRVILVSLSALVVSSLLVTMPDLAAAEVSRGDAAGLTLAYLDPGTGSFLIQAVAAGIAGAAVTLRLQWHRIKSLFGGSTNKIDADDDE